MISYMIWKYHIWYHSVLWDHTQYIIFCIWYIAPMQTMVGMSVMLTWTDQWMPTRSMTMLTKTSAWWGPLSKVISKSLTCGRKGMDLKTTPSVLHWQQLLPHYPTPIQGQLASWTPRRLCRHAAGLGQRQQALCCEHLDVELLQGLLPHGVYRRGWEDKERLSESRLRAAAETRKPRSEAAAAARAASVQGGGWADWTQVNDIMCHVIVYIIYDIIGMWCTMISQSWTVISCVIS